MVDAKRDVRSLDEYQSLALETDNYKLDDDAGLQVSILGLAGEAGNLVTWYKKRLRDGPAFTRFGLQTREELGDVLWYVSNIASRLGYRLSDVAQENLKKTRERWLTVGSPTFYDDEWPEAQRLPREFNYEYTKVKESGRSKVLLVDLDRDSAPVGNALTDNAYVEDGYRFHDVIHLAFAAHLAWSPVLRSLLKRKRKNDLQKDEVDDGARAQVVEEAIAASVFFYAEDNSFLEGVETLDWELLRTIKRLTANFEVSERTEAEWEQAIISGMRIWRQVNTARGGRVRGNLTKQTLEFEAC